MESYVLLLLRGKLSLHYSVFAIATVIDEQLLGNLHQVFFAITK